jgi:hypothetical protein
MPALSIPDRGVTMKHWVRAVLGLAGAPLLMAATDAPLKVEAMLARYHELTSPIDADERTCSRPIAGQADAILVCGRNASRQRVPFPEELGPPDGPRRPTGDPRAALAAAGPPCPPGGCTGVNLFKVPIALFRIVRQLADPDR